MKYILFKPGVEIPGYAIRMSSYMNYYIARIPDEYDDQRVELKNMKAIVIPSEFSRGYLFADIYKDYISVRTTSHIMDEFPDLATSSETDTEKVRHYLTDEDREMAVKFNKFVMLKVISDRFSEKMKNLHVEASDLELATWEEQKREALLYQSDNNASTPMLDILSIGRNIEKSVLVDKILTNVESYKSKLANLLVEQQLLESRVKECQTIADCHRLRHEKFGMSMSWQQQQDENIPESPLTLTMDF
jgi:hypothetical protein